MKRFIPIALVLAALAALVTCAGLPRPESEDNALVIGYIVLDFPDGFFQERARTVTDGLKVTFINQTRQKEFSVYTSDGYFYFLSNGSDDYVFKTYEYKTRASSGGTMSIGGGDIMREIVTAPGKVVYLGHLHITYASPKLTSRTGGDANTFWSFDIKPDMKADVAGLTDYIRDQEPDSPWLDREVVAP